MAKYRLLKGFHTQMEYRPATEDEIEYEEVKTVIRRGKHFVMDRVEYSARGNNVIDSDVDLVKKFGPQKFQILSVSQIMDNPWDNLDKMSIRQLTSFAESQELDLGETKGLKKADLVKKLRVLAGIEKEDAPKDKSPTELLGTS